MHKEIKILKAEKKVQVRFSEVDSMGIVWHGAYPLYFEDAREEFGSLYHLEYLRMYEFGFYAPLVELTFNYKRPIKHRDIINVVITYKDTDAAKILFDYEICLLNCIALLVFWTIVLTILPCFQHWLLPRCFYIRHNKQFFHFPDCSNCSNLPVQLLRADHNSEKPFWHKPARVCQDAIG